MQNLQLTETSTGSVFYLNEAQIISISEDGDGSRVLFTNEAGGLRNQKTVDQTPAFIASVSDTFIPVTEYTSGAVQYVSTDRISFIDPSGDQVVFRYNNEGMSPSKITITETNAAFQTLINEKASRIVYTFDDVTDGPDTIKLVAALGDLTATFVAGTRFTIFGSSTASMNTIWEVDSVAFAGGKTVITPTVAPATGASNTGSLVLN
jgi:hypothetical protein